ncbi:MAG: Smr/MutS family protein [Rhodospirillales bacterium]
MAGRRVKPHEAALWDTITGDIKPLASNKRKAVLAEEGESARAVPKAPKKSIIEPIKENVRTLSKNVDLPNPNANVDKRTLGRLKRGKLAIEGRLDLHGHTQASAHQALNDFIEMSYESQRRCVLVITGKGLRAADGNHGVLRQAVPRWLSDSKLKPMIVSWQPAQPRDGGDGALYVLIRRKR